MQRDVAAGSTPFLQPAAGMYFDFVLSSSYAFLAILAAHSGVSMFSFVFYIYDREGMNVC